jgi:HEPN domain-containing protein
VNKSDFERLTEVRIDEAKVLLNAGKPDGAYYLAGYAVECALKACIAKLTNQHDFPAKDAQKCYVHNLKNLLERAVLSTDLDDDTKNDPDLKTNWQIVKDWSEEARYDQTDKNAAQDLYDAITDTKHGVLPWLKLRW